MTMTVGLLPTVIQATLAALDRGEVRWCLLRGERALGQRDDDVDLLVAAEDMPATEAILTHLGYLELPSWGRGPHRFFLTYAPDDDLWLKLDVVSRLAFGRYAEIETGTAMACLDRRERAGPLYLLERSDRFWALMMHCLLDRKEFPPGHREALRALAGAAMPPSPLQAWFDGHAPEGWSGASVREAVSIGDWDRLRGLGRVLASSASGPSLRMMLRRGQGAGLRRMTKLRKLGWERGISVALLGPDGAGKSTLAAGLVKTFHFPVSTIYMGLYGAGPGGRPPRGFLGRLARVWAGQLRGAYHQSRGRLVVFDRWGYDARLAARPTDNLWSRLRRWLLSDAPPGPDLIIVLDAPPEMLLARKGEHDVETLEVQRRAYRALAERLPRAHLIAADRDPDTVRRVATALIWQRLRSRRGVNTTRTDA